MPLPVLPIGPPPRSATPAGSIGRKPPLAALVPTLAILAAAGCGEGEPALQVGSVAFHDEDVRGVSGEREETLVALAALGLAVAEDRLDEVGAPLARAGRRAELRRTLEDEVALAAAGVEDDHLRAIYETSPEYELEVRHILIQAEEWASDAEREDARRRAEEAREQALAREPFPELAAELSEEPGAAERGGLLEPGRDGSWVSEFWDAASALEEGEVSPVVETRFGFHVIRLEERRVVPFAEARGRVLREVARQVDATDAWAEYLADATGDLEVDGERIRWWRDGEADPGTELARWPGGSLTAEDFDEHAATLERPRLRALREGSAEPLAQEVQEAASAHLLAGRAEERGLVADASVEDEILREWELEARRWAAFLGFEDGLAVSEVGEAALEALGATGQNARLARDEVTDRGPLFRHAYPVTRGGGG